MNTKIQKWGNSQGLRLTRHLLDEAKIAVGDDVDISVQEGKIVISQVKHKKRKIDLRQLLADLPPDFKAEEVDWGKPVGKEVW